MKKYYFGIMICIMSILLVSCFPSAHQQSIDTTSDTPETETASQTFFQATYPEATVPTETSTTDATITYPISEYMNDFEEFGLFPLDRFTSELYHEKSVLSSNQLNGEGAIRFVVEGLNHLSYDGNMTIYNVRILEYYGFDEAVDTEKIYEMAYRGSPKNPLHDRPALQIGAEYLRFGKIDLNNTVIQASLIAPIGYVDGKVYVYGYGFDFSQLSCAIEITDEAENQIFKPGIHDKYIEYALANDIVLPTFDYKCELYALLRELGVLEK